MSDASDPTLGELGEFSLISSIIEPTLAAGRVGGRRGDDAGIVATSGGEHIAITCDVAPRPAAWDLLDRPWESWGWHAVVASLSDLAAAGAHPLALVTSVQAPGSMAARALQQFVSGVGKACNFFDIQHLGGNLRESVEFACHSTVLGEVGDLPALQRRGCKISDVLFVLGPCGDFAAAYLLAHRWGIESLEEAARLRLSRPRPMIREVRSIRQRGIRLHAATDNSDGLLGAVWNLAERSRCRVLIEINSADLSHEVRRAANALKIDALRLGLMWGDWNVVVAVGESEHKRLASLCNEARIPCVRIGRVIPGPPALMRNVGNDLRETRVLRNEAFAPWDYRTGTDAAMRHILNASLEVSSSGSIPF